MNGIKFISTKDSPNSSGESFVCVLSNGISTKHGLLIELSDKLIFPKYFGYNWDALIDCLMDFSWIKERKIIIVHSDLPSISTLEIRSYLNILSEATLQWNKDELHTLEVTFPKESESSIRELLK